MKKVILLIIISGFIGAGCADKTAEEKVALDSLIAIHDKVMGADEQLMKNKMLLDSMVKHNSTADIKDSVYSYLNTVNLADSAMENWMHNFNPDQTGKPHDAAMAYLGSQKKEIMAIDAQIGLAVAQSGKYLTKMKMK